MRLPSWRMARASALPRPKSCSRIWASEVLTPVRSGQFRRDVKRAEKRGKDLRKLRRLLELLIAGETLAAGYRDHPLKGGWKGYRDAHIEPDWLLLYRVAEVE